MKSYVFITGATGGVGQAFAAECAARGWDLFLTDLSEEPLNLVSQGLGRLYSINALTYACDLADSGAREGLWQHVARRGLRFHMLINVAGIEYQGPFSERQPAELQAIVRLNVESTIETTRRVLTYRDPVRTLHIINVSSLAAFYPMPVKAVYAASKRFLLDWSLALDAELRDQNATVTALCPAGMPTTPACIRSIEAQGLMGRLTTMNTSDVAARTIDHALAGHRVFIPGALNRLLRVLGALLPRPFLASAINRRWAERHRLAHGTVTALVVPVSSHR
ncbi:MAG: SDR family NAD(P)-dependent oxidoreductase [Anaerolineae bacterium]